MAMKTKLVLLVEGDRDVAGAIAARLERRADFLVDVASTGDDALRHIAALVPDAMLLDTTLRDLPAQELCRSIRSRERTASMPCIMLGDPKRGLRSVEALAFGADDFVTKPVDGDELEARLRAVLRRHAPRPLCVGPQDFRGAHLEANFADVVVSVDGTPVNLTRRELLLLRALVERHNRILSRDELSRAWGSDARDCRVVDSAMWKLRRKLGNAGRQIETVIGLGYRFNEPKKQGEQAS
jgi:two-component system, OmpR family, phosphate regulon response regulator PhoB